MPKELKDLTIAEVCAVMDQQQPGWELAWASQQDLRDADEYSRLLRKDFLQEVASDKVMLVLRSAYHASLRGEAKA